MSRPKYTKCARRAYLLLRWLAECEDFSFAACADANARARYFHENEDRLPVDVSVAEACEVIGSIQRIPGLKPVRFVGAGGQGVVIEAGSSKQRRIVKWFNPMIAGSAAPDLEQQSELMTALAHKSQSFPAPVSVATARVLRCTLDEGELLALVSEVAGAQTLRAYLRDSEADRASRLTLFGGLVEAVEVLHSHSNHVHFDLTPENVLMDAAGKPKLIDLALVRQVTGAAGITDSDARGRGTAGYAPPEQLDRDSKAVLDQRADIHALGAILFEVLTGEPLLQELDEDRSTTTERIRAALADDSRLAQTVVDATEPDPARRLANIAQLRARLSPSRHEPFDPTPAASRIQRRLAAVRAETLRADLLGLITENKAHAISLQRVYVELKVQHVERSPSKVKGKDDAASQQVVERTVTLDFFEAARRFPCLLVLGEMGSGKTTAIRRYAKALHDVHPSARGATDADREGARRLLGLADGAIGTIEPLLVPLRELPLKDRHDHTRGDRGTPALLELLALWQRDPKEDAAPPTPSSDVLSADELARAVRSGSVSLLLDGFDEVKGEDKTRLSVCLAKYAEWRAKFAPRSQLLVTARESSLAQLASFRACIDAKHVAEATVQQLGDAERAELTKALYGALEQATQTKRPGGANRLLAAFADESRSEHSELVEMTRWPVLLTLIVLVHFTKGELPDRRATLYEIALGELERRIRNSQWSPRTIRECLADVAWTIQNRSHTRPPARVLSQERHDRELREGLRGVIERALASESESGEIDPGEARRLADEFIAEQQRDGILRNLARPEQPFLHRSFLEFLAAFRLVRLPEAEMLDGFRRGLSLVPEWREVLRLAAGLLAERGSAPIANLFAELAKEPALVAQLDPILADLRAFDLRRGEVLVPLRARAGSFALRVEDPKIDLHERVGLAEVLGRIGDPRLAPSTPPTNLTEKQRRTWVAQHSRWVDVPVANLVQAPETPSLNAKIQRWTTTIGEWRTFAEAEAFEPDLSFLNGWLYRADRQAIERLAKDPHARAPAEWRQLLRSSPNHPMVHIDWWMVCAYCAWLNHERPTSHFEAGAEREVVAPPPESLWQFAADSGDGREYPWDVNSDQPAGGARAATDRTGLHRAAPVGCFPTGRGPFGGWDQAGNVWEWCLDEFGDTQWGVFRVQRGGGFEGEADYGLCTFRHGGHPSDRIDDIGFRPARVTADLLHYFTAGSPKKTR